MIGYLYSTIGVITAFGYLPQVLALIRAQTKCEEVSLRAWIIWEYTSIVSLLYGLFELNDLKFTLVNTVNTFFVSLIVAIIIYKRHKYRDHIPVMIDETDIPDETDIAQNIDVNYSGS